MRNDSQGKDGTSRDLSSARSCVTRRAMLGLAAATALHGARKNTGRARRGAAPLEACPARVAGTVRERLWLSVGVGESAMTPAESALYLGVPNLILSVSPKTRELDRQWAISVSGFRQVIWPADESNLVTGSVRSLLIEFPNFTGVLHNTAAPTDSDRSPDIPSRRDVWVDVHQKAGDWLRSDDARLQYATVVVLWPADDEPESALARWEEQGHAAGVGLGCSLQGDAPVKRLRQHCDLALKWMRSGRIGGLVFGAGRGMGADSAAIDFARQWISVAGGQLL